MPKNWENVAWFFMTDEQKRKIDGYDRLKRRIAELEQDNRRLKGIANMGRNRPAGGGFW